MEDGSIRMMSEEEFAADWRQHYLSLFSGATIDNRPFRKPDWTVRSFGAPAYFLGLPKERLSVEQCSHLLIYEALEHEVINFGGREIVGFLHEGPHLNPSIFHVSHIRYACIREMRELAVDGFDLHVFSRSSSWGMVVSWEEDFVALGGEREFMRGFVERAGGDDAVRADFEFEASALEGMSGDSERLVSCLRKYNDDAL